MSNPQPPWTRYEQPSTVPYGTPYPQHITIAAPRPAPRQSCLLHAVLLVFTLGLGNVAYAVWHQRHYAQR